MIRILVVSVLLGLSAPVSSEMRFTFTLPSWGIEGGVLQGALEGRDPFDETLYYIGDRPRLGFVKSPGRDGWDEGPMFLKRDFRGSRGSIAQHRWEGTVWTSVQTNLVLSYFYDEKYEMGGLLVSGENFMIFSFPASGQNSQFPLPPGTWDLTVWATPVPEPAGLVGLGTGAVLLGVYRRRRR